MSHALNLAQMIASKSPVATAGIKNVLVHARDHSVAEGLKYVAVWNARLVYIVSRLLNGTDLMLAVVFLFCEPA